MNYNVAIWGSRGKIQGTVYGGHPERLLPNYVVEIDEIYSVNV